MENQQKSLTPISKLFENAYSIYKEKFWLFTKLAAFNLAPLAVMAFCGGFFAAVIFVQKSSFNLALLLFGVLVLLVGILISIIVGIWVYAATFFALKEPDSKVSIKKVFLSTKPYLWSFFWVSFLSGIATAVGFILFIIPGIIFGVWFSLSLYVFIFEDIKGTSALKKSKEMVKGYWWPVFGRIIIIGVISWLVSSIEFFGPIINLLFVVPFSIVFEYLIYQDLKR